VTEKGPFTAKKKRGALHGEGEEIFHGLSGKGKGGGSDYWGQERGGLFWKKEKGRDDEAKRGGNFLSFGGKKGKNAFPIREGEERGL